MIPLLRERCVNNKIKSIPLPKGEVRCGGIKKKRELLFDGDQFLGGFPIGFAAKHFVGLSVEGDFEACVVGQVFDNSFEFFSCVLET